MDCSVPIKLMRIVEWCLTGYVRPLVIVAMVGVVFGLILPALSQDIVTKVGKTYYINSGTVEAV